LKIGCLVVISTSLEAQIKEINLVVTLLNKAISDLDLVEIPFSGRSFTWSNMQDDPLLVKLD
jgi:hypothetical protein